MAPIDDNEITATMLQFGGSFVKKLAEAFRYADPQNQATLKAAFPALWEQYAELAKMRRGRT